MVIEPVRYALESALLQRMGLSHAGPRLEETVTKRLRMGEKEVEETTTRPLAQDDDMDYRVSRIYETFGNVAVIQLSGVIDKHISDWDMMCFGGCDIADFDNALIEAAADDDIECVVLNINSPGGSVTGVPESAARVAALAEKKEVRAFVDSMACSAAYYIASQADKITAAPSAILGSIGVYMATMDATRAAEMEGYKVELITAGKFKAMGSPFKPLSDEERGMLQSSVNSLHADFKEAVRSGRRGPTERGGHQTVLDSAMEGQWFDGKSALQARLVDVLTGENLDEYVGKVIDGQDD